MRGEPMKLRVTRWMGCRPPQSETDWGNRIKDGIGGFSHGFCFVEAGPGWQRGTRNGSVELADAGPTGP